MTGSTVNLKGWAAVVIAAVVAACLLALLVATKPADAAGRYKTLTKTLSNPSAITINDAQPATPYPSTLAAGGMRRGKVLDMNLTLNNVSHTFPQDLDVLLVGPRGQQALVVSDVGGGGPGVSDVTLTLDDEATNSLPINTSPLSGSYQPTDADEFEGDSDSFASPAPTTSGGSALSAFDRTNPNGTWQLYVEDQWGGEVGEFAGGWSLTIRARVLR